MSKKNHQPTEEKKTSKKIPIEEPTNQDAAQPETDPRPLEPEPGADDMTDATTAQLEQEIDELKQRLQRLGADYQNYQKRSHTQMEQAVKFANENLMKSLLPVIDNFEHTLENLKKNKEAGDIEPLLKGVKIVYDHMMDILKNSGMQRIEITPGCEFDPSMHEAMLHEESETLPANSVVRELQAGFVLNDRTLRPAKVSVARAPANPNDTPAAPEADADREENQDEG